MFAAHNALFTPPPSGPPASSVKALLHLNTDFTDSSSVASAWNSSGSASVSSAQSKFGGKSLALSGGYIYPSATGSNFAFGNGDFTIEMWVYPTGTNDYSRIYDSRPGSQGAYPQMLMQANKIDYYVNSGLRIAGSVTVSNSTWSHVALCRASGTTRMFINGSQSGSSWSDTTTYLNSDGYPRIGESGIGSAPFSGYIDEIRICTVALYTAAFAAPTSEFT